MVRRVNVQCNSLAQLTKNDAIYLDFNYATSTNTGKTYTLNFRSSCSCYNMNSCDFHQFLLISVDFVRKDTISIKIVTNETHHRPINFYLKSVELIRMRLKFENNRRIPDYQNKIHHELSVLLVAHKLLLRWKKLNRKVTNTFLEEKIRKGSPFCVIFHFLAQNRGLKVCNLVHTIHYFYIFLSRY
jgi:hypothetical protein